MSFEAFAAQLQTEYEKIAPDERWIPPDGEYDVLMVDFRTGTYLDNQEHEVPYIASSYEMVGGDFDGTRFDGGMTSIRSPKALGFVKRFLTRALGGSASGIFKDDCDALAQVCANQSLPCKVRVVRNIDQNGREWPNVYLQSASAAVAA